MGTVNGLSSRFGRFPVNVHLRDRRMCTMFDGR